MSIKKSFPSSLALLALIVVAATAVSSVALAAPTTKPSKPGGGSSVSYIGNDVSWPQCGSKLPTDHAFGIVGVNGGLATNTNPCMGEQLAWANTAPGTTGQAKLQLYVNTANPGMLLDDPRYSVKETWPTDNLYGDGLSAPNPHGQCDGTNSVACSWQYGWNRAYESAQQRFIPAAQTAGVSIDPSQYKWWLDVETENSWQNDYDTSPEAYQKNVATLEAMTAYFTSIGAKVGVYSTGYQWGVITKGAISESSNLNGLDSWLAGSRNLSAAKSDCSSKAGLTPGSKVVLTQYVSKNLDYNYSCVQ